MKRVMAGLVVLLFLVSCVPTEQVVQEPIELPEPVVIEEPKPPREPTEKEITQVKKLCNDVCSANKFSTQYRVFYNYTSESFLCECTDGTGFVEGRTTLIYNLSLEGELRWKDLPITFSIDEDICKSYETRKIERAFEEIEKKTKGVVKFKRVSENANIHVACSYLEGCYKKVIDIDKEAGVIRKSESICAHVKGLAQITEKFGNQIKKAKIEMIGLDGFAETGSSGMSGFYVGSCGHPTTEIHEILHTFGYGHKEDPKSIMYKSGDLVAYTLQAEGACIDSDKEIDQEIIEELIDVYTE